jgi:hypothetical protein
MGLWSKGAMPFGPDLGLSNGHRNRGASNHLWSAASLPPSQGLRRTSARPFLYGKDGITGTKTGTFQKSSRPGWVHTPQRKGADPLRP